MLDRKSKRWIVAASIAVLTATAGFAQSEDQDLVPVLKTPGQYEVLDNGCRERPDVIEWTFEWSKVPNAKAYHLYVKRDGSEFPLINAQGVKKTKYTRKNLAYIAPQNATGWKWRVRALVNGKWQAWTPEREFSVEPIDTDC